MRRFIYLDIDSLNSYLAQIFDGVIQSQETEKTVDKKREKQHRFADSIGGEIAFKLFGKGVDANAQAAYEHLKTVANDVVAIYYDNQLWLLLVLMVDENDAP